MFLDRPCRFVVVSVLSKKQQTPVAKRTLNPTYSAKDATFDFPIYLSLAEKLGAIELIIWDKDVLKKDYLGEVAIPLDDWFRDDNAHSFDDPSNMVLLFDILSALVTQLRLSRSRSTWCLLEARLMQQVLYK